MGIAVFRYGDPEREAFGIWLLDQVSALLRAEFDVPPLAFAPVGPDFSYDSYPALFRGRRGRGPLHVVWDTNLLVDYFEHGLALWENESLPDLVPGYGDELEALQLIVALWVIRDIRFHVLPRVLVDARRKLSKQRLGERFNALGHFAAALRLVGSGDQELDAPTRDGLLVLPRSELQRTLERVPSSDHALVRDAVNLGAHVFLTRDKGVRACRKELLPFGLNLLRVAGHSWVGRPANRRHLPVRKEVCTSRTAQRCERVADKHSPWTAEGSPARRPAERLRRNGSGPQLRARVTCHLGSEEEAAVSRRRAPTGERGKAQVSGWSGCTDGCGHRSVKRKPARPMVWPG